jgi:hypothetical protein
MRNSDGLQAAAILRSNYLMKKIEIKRPYIAVRPFY